ncbi:hypothetical protein WJX72_010265 [[Myrmecia] bisecta]|uniref:AP2/ERF domain-containing protein n=1 Tax=[Myrmecia] bisecta TaxID=41462 RepID=A0AAW1P8Y3_9CHLO
MASTGKWLAQCSSAGKQRYLGIYSKEEDAARAYDAAAVIFKGPDTPLNFPNDPPPKPLSPSTAAARATSSAQQQQQQQLQVNGKAESIGYYSDEETAARAYDEAAVRVKGNEAVLNMPHEHPIVGGHVHAGFPPRIPAHPRQHAQQLQRGQSGSQELDGEGQAHMRFASSQFRGVSWESRHAKWRVELHLGTGAQQQVRFVGYYDNEVEAAHMHDKAVLEAEGPQAVLNFPVPQAPEQGMPAFPPPTHMSVASFNNGYLAPVGQPGKPGYGRRDAPQSQTYQPYDRLATVADGGPSQAAPGAYVGVRWDQSAGRWRADLTYNNQEVLIGHFGSQLAAAQAYDETMHAVYGPNAPTNFPLASNEAAPMHAGSLERHQGPEGSSRNPQQAQNAAPHDVQGQREHAGSVWAKAEPAQRQPGAQGGRNQVPAQQQAGQPGTAARSYHGVKFDEASRQWLAHFWHEGQAIFIGAFDTAEIAGEAHDQVALAVHGPQARLPGPPAAPADAREAAAAPHQQDEHSPRAGKQLHAGPRPGSGQAQQGSRYLGVTWKPRIQRWRASVHHTDKAAFLGDFVDKRDAALAYDRAVLELDGPNAQTNFPYSQPGHTQRPANREPEPRAATTSK